MLLNCDAGEVSWESLGWQGFKPVNPIGNRPWIFLDGLVLKLPCFGQLTWRADPLEKTLMLAGGEGDGRGWDGWMASLTQWTWFEQTPGDSEGQGSLACCSPWGHRESWLIDWTTTHFTFTSYPWRLLVCSQYLWECLFLISHKGDDTVFVFIWLISLSIVPFGPYMLFQVPGIPFFPPLFMYLAMLGLCCCTQAFPGCSRWRATLRCGVEAHCCGFSCCGALAPGAWALVDAASGLSSFDAWASLPWNMWDIPGLGIELVSPTFAGGFLTTESPRRTQVPWFLWLNNIPLYIYILHLLYMLIHRWILGCFCILAIANNAAMNIGV